MDAKERDIYGFPPERFEQRPAGDGPPASQGEPDLHYVTPPPAPRPPVFGLDPEARPGQVPWGWARAMGVLLSALAGLLLLIVVLSLATTGSSGGSSGASSSAGSATVAGALAALVSTLVVDSWFVGVAWFSSLRRFSLPLASWGFRRLGLAVLRPVPLALILVYVASVAYNIIVHPPEQKLLQDFPHGSAGVALFSVMAIVVAPVFEETFFRGFLFQGLARSFGPVVGAVLSAAVFSLAHQQLSIFVPLFVLGLLLAWSFYRTGSLYTNIALHASFNAVSVALWAGFGVVLFV